MKEYVFDKVNESLYKETLDNGVEVYLYPFPNTKNFYVTISVKYGSKYTQYKLANKTYDIIPGSAHFLEHRIMLIGEDPALSKRINDLGSLANAWTSNHVTNYNIFGSENIEENIRILFDLFYNVKFLKKDVDEEKGIIAEEIDMDKDNLERYLTNCLNKNLFTSSHKVNTVIGEKEDINKITPKSLQEIYDHFYIPNNTFVVVSGNFNKDEVMEEIKQYYSKLKLVKKELPKRIPDKEKDTVRVEYEEIKKDIEDVRVKYGFKIKKSIFNIEDDSILQSYLDIILKLNFSSTSKLFEKYKNDKLMFVMNAYSSIIDDYVVVVVSAITDKPNELINSIKKDIKKLSLNSEEFERTKKKYIKRYIMSFENIEDVEYNITNSLSIDGKIDYDEYEFLNNMSYKTAVEIMNKIDSTNYSIIRTIK